MLVALHTDIHIATVASGRRRCQHRFAKRGHLACRIAAAPKWRDRERRLAIVRRTSIRRA